MALKRGIQPGLDFPNRKKALSQLHLSLVHGKQASPNDHNPNRLGWLARRVDASESKSTKLPKGEEKK